MWPAGLWPSYGRSPAVDVLPRRQLRALRLLGIVPCCGGSKTALQYIAIRTCTTTLRGPTRHQSPATLFPKRAGSQATLTACSSVGGSSWRTNGVVPHPHRAIPAARGYHPRPEQAEVHAPHKLCVLLGDLHHGVLDRVVPDVRTHVTVAHTAHASLAQTNAVAAPHSRGLDQAGRTRHVLRHRRQHVL